MENNEKKAGVAGTATPATGANEPATTAESKPAAKSATTSGASKPAATKPRTASATTKPDDKPATEVKPAKKVEPATGTIGQGDQGNDDQAKAASNSPEKTLAKGKDVKREIAKNLGVKTLFENDKGEYFTSENLAMLSVNQDANKVSTHNF